MRMQISLASQAFSPALVKRVACFNISMSWSCKRCTFLNHSSQKSACQACLSSPLSLSPPPSASSSSSFKWSCKACTFLNSFPLLNISVVFIYDCQPVGTMFLHRLFLNRKLLQIYLTFLRNLAGGMYIAAQFLLTRLTQAYTFVWCTIPFSNSIMGRELCIAEIEAMNGKPFVVATSHLESPCPVPPKWDQIYSKERVEQAHEAINILCKYRNVVFGGGMNWDDKLDGQFPLQDGWIDAWSQLRPNENGWTYDTKSNQMLTGNQTLQKRLDRFICSLQIS